ncbi:MAG: hypothetical protein ACI837_001538 [Crocinitomicaceae bacterium]|jgi:hypothetical protein
MHAKMILIFLVLSHFNSTAQFSLNHPTCGMEYFNCEVILGDRVNICWRTYYEIDNSTFTIERSTNAALWEEVVNIKGADYSENIINYQVEDETPYDNISYYRLKQTDMNGVNTYSELNTVEIDHVQCSSIRAYPNPLINELTITGSNYELSEIQVLNLAGEDETKKSIIYRMTETKMKLNLFALSSGIYIVRTKTMVAKVTKK